MDKDIEIILFKLKYKQTQPKLYMLQCESGIRLFQDYRKGKLTSYAFNGNESVQVNKVEEQQEFIANLEAMKCKTLDKY